MPDPTRSPDPAQAPADAAPADLRLVGLRKVFASRERDGKDVVAVDDVDLALRKGQLVTLLGPSGCGKTTLLRMIAGFEEPTSGDIYFGEQRVNELAPNVRDAAMVFQSYAIFPHLSVSDNVAFGLRLQRLARGELQSRVQRVLGLVGLTGLQERAPSQLSGGQQQRVALARCIVMEPRLLLFDEPLSNLDAKLREQMRLEIRDLQQRLGITSVYVTHDQIEAMALSDLVVVMNEGRVEQIGAPTEVYARPRNRFVADFIGKANFVGAVAAGPHELQVNGRRVDVPNGVPFDAGSEVTAVIRPEALTLRRDPPDEVPDGTFDGTVARATFLGTIGEVEVEIPGQGRWLVDVPNAAEVGLPAVGDRVGVDPSPRSVHVLPG
jgi:iron(III) transport system ATP-binding protein